MTMSKNVQNHGEKTCETNFKDKAIHGFFKDKYHVHPFFTKFMATRLWVNQASKHGTEWDSQILRTNILSGEGWDINQPLGHSQV